uniref:Uncharacterized protein n=1 Tax=Arundo donax TaxID=35708 RepID=A0A0A9FBL0_ARUDO
MIDLMFPENRTPNCFACTFCIFYVLIISCWIMIVVS